MSAIQHPQRGEIYWADLRPAKGSEQNGSRPVLIVSNNLMNETNSIVLIAPLTTNDEKVKVGPFNILLVAANVTLDSTGVAKLLKDHSVTIRTTDRAILCNQVRAITKNRLVGRVGNVNDRGVIEKVNTAIVDAFALDACEYCDLPLRPDAVICGKCRQPHRKKCRECHRHVNKRYNFCPYCGKEV